jgi:hypothetical protein
MCESQRVILERSRPIGSGCRVWVKSVDRDGYARVKFQGKRHGAHRLAYEAFVGSIPAGHELHHECMTPACVNPAHLVPMSREAHRALHMDAEALRMTEACRHMFRSV